MDGAVERIRSHRRDIISSKTPELTCVFYIWLHVIVISLVGRELELELAQTKLALVETECKNQDLTHQFTVTQVSKIFQHWPSVLKQSGFQGKLQWTSVQHLVVQDPQFHQGGGRWEVLTSCVYEVCESSPCPGSKGNTMKTPESMKKSSSEQAIGSNGKWSYELWWQTQLLSQLWLLGRVSPIRMSLHMLCMHSQI